MGARGYASIKSMVGVEDDFNQRTSRRIYEGPLRLVYHEGTIDGEGAIKFTVNPSPRFVFDFATDEPPGDFVFGARGMEGPKRVEVLGDPPPLKDPFEHEARDWFRTFDGPTTFSTTWPLPRGLIIGPAAVTRIRYAVLNNDPWILPGSGRTWGGQYEFETRGWRVRLEPTISSDDYSKKLDAKGGFGITHWFTVERCDGARFEVGDTGRLRLVLFHVLSFARGSLVGIALGVGYDDRGAVSCIECWDVVASPWRRPLTWCDLRNVHAIGDLAETWMNIEPSSSRDRILSRAVRTHASANRLDGVDMSIPTACTGLELLGWMVLVREEGWLTDDEDARLTAAGKLRLLLRWARISPEVPRELEHLRRFANGKDAPSALTEVRNDLVHPPRKRADWPDTDLMIDTWRLGMEFMDLVILRALGYEGQYVHRRHLGGPGIGAGEPVPWAGAES